MESPGWYPDAEPYEFGGVEQAEEMTDRPIAPAAKIPRNLLMDASPIPLRSVSESRSFENHGRVSRGHLFRDHSAPEDIGAPFNGRQPQPRRFVPIGINYACNTLISLAVPAILQGSTTQMTPRKRY
ncbi:hypothetical protein RHE_CH01801 [Rhizobium etli CFN 42]|uniref:Uncharacterized protein n=1 Tax=Rhizobium etli (strain ATCC 51251 / DSM 11541 / JCM 21823 / NBRC 15573 / CFN 42) TaxID=347834 RepID=Q2K990_RHIEC|nr:hypothetical protein RHE_CH01801 [Rhizobium etli CFN 42]